MGADMIVTILATKRDARVDYDAGREFLGKFDFTEPYLIDNLVNEGILYEDDDEPYCDRSGNVLPDKVAELYAETIDELQNCLNGRNVACVGVRDLWCYITGGLSWGDDTEEGIIFSRIESLPGLAEAMGFIPNWHEVDPTVSPEEEAAAVQSIQAVALQQSER